VLASKSQLAALGRASQPVYTELERSSETKSFIARIRRLRATTPAPAPPVIPPSCSRVQRPPPLKGKLRSPSILNGTYHLGFTISADPSTDHQPPKTVETRVLNNGRFRWAVGEPGEWGGTYTIRGNRITFISADSGSSGLTFVFSLDRDGKLRLKPVLPMDRGDRWVDAGEPWQRVGPARQIP
jgi:hypothetical protein